MNAKTVSGPASGVWGLQLVELVSDLIAIVQDEALVFINPAGARILGAANQAELIGQRLESRVHPDYRAVVADACRALHDEIHPVPIRLLGLKGETVEVEITVRPLSDGSGGLLVQGRDVTQANRAALGVRDREGKLAGLLETIREGIVTADGQGTIQSFNPAAEAMFGYGRAEVIGKNLSVLMPEPHATLHAGYLENYHKTGRTWIMGTTRELEGRRKDGTLFPVEINVSALGEGKARQFVGVLRDITARKKAEERLMLAATVFEQAAEGIAILDERFHVTAVNPAFTAITGYDLAAVAGQTPPFLRNSFQDEAFFAAMWDSINREGRWQGELWCRRKSGERYAERLSVTAVEDERTYASHYVVVGSDVTQRRLDEERIRYQANHDMLTDLPNRSLFLDRLGQAIDQARASQGRGALLFLDLDGFRQVNDTLGHDVGDLLLREASRRLVHTIRAQDLAARLGGDEFVVLMSVIDRPEEAARQAQHIIETLRLPFDLDGYEAFISAYVGIALFPGGIEDSPQILLKNATAAKTRAREQGKAGFGFFTPEITEAFNERLTLKNSLTKALERDEFLLNYQPKLDLANGRIIGVEALLRWKSPWLGPVPPVKFVPILEETGMIVEVGEWVLETACQQYRQWADQGHAELSIAVNLSARQLRPGIVATIDNILRRTGVDPKGLEIEITESLIMNDAELAVNLLRQLSEMGIRLSMDDFGTGYSSLSHLRKFPLDTIKIDRSFIQEMTNNRDDSEIVRTIVTLGHALNRRVVAEGVETVAQLGLLNTLECDEIQGYLLSPPIPAEGILDLKTNSPAPRLLAEAGAVH